MRSIMGKGIYSKDYKDLARKLREVRKALGLTQVEVSDRLRRPQSYLSKVELGQYYIDVFELRALARIYKKKVGDFVR